VLLQSSAFMYELPSYYSEDVMPVAPIAILVTLAVIGAAAWHRRRWVARHTNDPKATAPIVAAVSPCTGELIATGQEAVSDHGIGNTSPPESIAGAGGGGAEV